mmetsp:Transcript_12809/g.24281  ORF Transcript_12809/g.24281 Transcript_12809/m.24281 type:complete len:387 (-) Transcript_12809:1378-2538(-)
MMMIMVLLLRRICRLAGYWRMRLSRGHRTHPIFKTGSLRGLLTRRGFLIVMFIMAIATVVIVPGSMAAATTVATTSIASEQRLFSCFTRRRAHTIQPFPFIDGAVTVIHSSTAMRCASIGIDFSGVPSIFSILICVWHTGNAGRAIFRITSPIQRGRRTARFRSPSRKVGPVTMVSSGRVRVRRDCNGRRRANRLVIILCSDRTVSAKARRRSISAFFLLFLVFHLNLTERRIDDRAFPFDFGFDFPVRGTAFAGSASANDARCTAGPNAFGAIDLQPSHFVEAALGAVGQQDLPSPEHLLSAESDHGVTDAAPFGIEFGRIDFLCLDGFAWAKGLFAVVAFMSRIFFFVFVFVVVVIFLIQFIRERIAIHVPFIHLFYDRSHGHH